MLSTMKLVVASGGMALSLTAGAGIASAEPDVSPIINSTCTYPQVMAALGDQSPELADQLSTTPAANAWLQGLIAASPDQRRIMVDAGAGRARGSAIHTGDSASRQYLQQLLSGTPTVTLMLR
jgi:hypothetical protein